MASKSIRNAVLQKTNKGLLGKQGHQRRDTNIMYMKTGAYVTL